MRWDVVFEPKIDMEPIFEILVQIEAYKLSVLKLPVPPRIAKKVNEINIVRQIKGTTGIEGNTLSEEKITELITPQDMSKCDSPVTTQNNEQQEIKNAHCVLDYIKQYTKANPGAFVTEELIRKIHELTTVGCDYPDNRPGYYKRTQNTAGLYTPPAPEEVPEHMSRFIDLINSGRAMAWGNVIRAVVAHFYLVTIHPFSDGNGRTSRALEAYILYSGGYNVHGFYSLANYFYKNRQRYIDELQDARFKYNGNLTSFVKFSLNGFVEELQEVQDEILKFYTRLGYESFISELHSSGEINSRVYNILLYMSQSGDEFSLVDFKTKTHPLISALYQRIKTNKTAVRDIKSMLEHGLITWDKSSNRIKINSNIMLEFAD